MASKNTHISFEDALEHLETLIESMENGDVPLADLVAKFEEGSTLLKICRKELNAAELRIEKLNLENREIEAFEDESSET